MSKPNSKGMLPNGRSASGHMFVRALHAIFDHPDYIALPKTARAFLWDIARQFNGYNNGDLSAALGTMSRWGWTKEELKKARRDAELAGWIEVTRYPRFPRDPTLYRLTWLPVSKELRPKNKLDRDAFAQKVRSLRY